MRKRKMILLIILLLSIGFASVSTTFYLYNIASIESNETFTNDIIFSAADTYDESEASIDNLGKTITFNSKFMKKVGEKTVLDYTLSNYNRQYDAAVEVVVKMKNENNLYNDYVKITNSINENFILPAQTEENGRLEIMLIKPYEGEEPVEISFGIEYQAEGIERSSIATETLIKSCEINSEWIFDYLGKESEFKAPCSGIYKLEVWGAQGGASNATYIGGYGGFSSGEVKLTKNKTIYINVGGAGAANGNPHSSVGASGGYNGGGSASPLTTVNHLYGAGGGGSGYIGNSLLSNKVMYCYNCEESQEVSTKTIKTTNVSQLPLTNYAKQGHGYAKITYLRSK